ncbi:MAG: hypothetical protein FWF18_04280 [Dehalococcoidia bacterium]|nr:hypothetical protein [Dehalococcoidia bacterium]
MDPIIEPTKGGITQNSQTSENITQDDNFVQDTIAGIAAPNIANKKGYSHFQSALLIFNTNDITSDNIGIIK